MVISRRAINEKIFFCRFPIHLSIDIEKSTPYRPLQFVRVSQSFQLDVYTSALADF